MSRNFTSSLPLFLDFLFTLRKRDSVCLICSQSKYIELWGFYLAYQANFSSREICKSVQKHILNLNGWCAAKVVRCRHCGYQGFSYQIDLRSISTPFCLNLKETDLEKIQIPRIIFPIHTRIMFSSKVNLPSLAPLILLEYFTRKSLCSTSTLDTKMQTVALSLGYVLKLIR